MTFSEKLVRLRKIRGLTQDELASAVGVSRQAVYKWECGQSYPEVSKLLEIKILFGISIDDLLDDSYEIPLPEKKKRRRSTKAKDVTAEAETVHAPADEANIPVTLPDLSESRPVYSEPDVTSDVAAEPEQESVHESAPAEEPASPVSEPVAEPAAEHVIETVAEPEVKEEPKAEEPEVSAPAAKEEPKAEEHTEKKRGFFGRLFGRR